MRYQTGPVSALLTSAGIWSSIAIAICGCCAAVVFLRARSKEREARPFIRDLERGRRMRSSSGNESELQIVFRAGSPSFPLGPDRPRAGAL
jgi:hypothetical protein